MYRVPCLGGWILRRLISLMDLCLSNTWPWFKCVCLTWTCARAPACVCGWLCEWPFVWPDLHCHLHRSAGCEVQSKLLSATPEATGEAAIDYKTACRAADKYLTGCPRFCTGLLPPHWCVVGSASWESASRRLDLFSPCSGSSRVEHCFRPLTPRQGVAPWKPWPSDIRWHNATMIDLH